MEAIELRRDVIAVTGPDATTYLQGQLSQDLDAIAIGASAWSFVLAPTGMVDGWFRITNRGDQGWLIDTDPGNAEALVARLERFKLRVDCTIEPVAWRMVRVLGSGVEPVDGCVVVELEWPELRGHDRLGPAPVRPDDATPLAPADHDVRRLTAGVPCMGVDIEIGAMPASTGQVDRSVSFTKGCYTGQELVARVDSRGGRAPTRLVRCAAGPGVLAPGGELVDSEGVIGTVTSAQADVENGRTVGIASVARRAVTPAVVSDGASNDVTLMPLEAAGS